MKHLHGINGLSFDSNKVGDVMMQLSGSLRYFKDLTQLSLICILYIFFIQQH